MSDDLEREHVSPLEAAALMGVTRRFIYTLIDRGRLPVARVSRCCLRIRRSDVIALLTPPEAANP